MIWTPQPPSMAYGYASPASPWWPYAKYPDLHRGRVAAWCPSLGNTADIAHDFTGNRNTGTMQPTFATGPTWVNDSGRPVLSFDGVNDRIDLPNNSLLLPGTGSFSISLRTIPLVVTGTPRIVYYPRANNANNYYIMLNNSGFRVNFSDSGGSSGFAQQPTTLSVGSTYHVVGVRDKATGTVRLHVNGVNVDENSDASGDIATTFKNLTLCARWATSGYIENYSGIIDDVQIYNRALNANEIQLLYQLGPGGSYAIDEEMFAAEQAEAFKAYWARRTTVIIGGGVS